MVLEAKIMAHYGTTSPPDDKGFICYCPRCETSNSVDDDTVDQETGDITCVLCGLIFYPIET